MKERKQEYTLPVLIQGFRQYGINRSKELMPLSHSKTDQDNNHYKSLISQYFPRF